MFFGRLSTNFREPNVEVATSSEESEPCRWAAGIAASNLVRRRLLSRQRRARTRTWFYVAESRNYEMPGSIDNHTSARTDNAED
jgi:hypothetical protein